MTYKARYWVGHADYIKYIQLIFGWALGLYTTKTKKEKIYYLYINIHQYNFQIIFQSFLKEINMTFTNTFSWISKYLLGSYNFFFFKYSETDNETNWKSCLVILIRAIENKCEGVQNLVKFQPTVVALWSCSFEKLFLNYTTNL